MAADLSMPLWGTPLYPSPYVKEGEMMYVQMGTPNARIYFHQRISRRRRWRKPHGRTNCRRRMKEKRVLYRPDYDRLKEVSNARTVKDL